MIEHIDLYCERTAIGFWNEPVNALSNLAFIAASIYATSVLRQRGGGDVLEYLLIVLAACIGLGSFLFHTFANTWTELADVIPIWSFVALFVFSAIYRATGDRLFRTVRISMIALGVTGAVFYLTATDVVSDTAHGGEGDLLNGSLQYLPALIALLAFAALAIWRQRPERHLILAAACTFLASLMLRTIDLETCAITGIGTHFLWHILNGAMVGLLLIALIRHMPPAAVRDISGSEA